MRRLTHTHRNFFSGKHQEEKFSHDKSIGHTHAESVILGLVNWKYPVGIKSEKKEAIWGE